MTPSELWEATFPGITPREFWNLSKATSTQHAEEAVDLALAGWAPFHSRFEAYLDEPERDVLSRYLAASVPGVSLDGEDPPRLPGW
jgi:hypothetical protein